MTARLCTFSIPLQFCNVVLDRSGRLDKTFWWNCPISYLPSRGISSSIITGSTPDGVHPLRPKPQFMDKSHLKAVRKLPSMTWLGTTALTITAALRDHQTIKEKLALIGDLQAFLRLQKAEILRRAREQALTPGGRNLPTRSPRRYQGRACSRSMNKRLNGSDLGHRPSANQRHPVGVVASSP